jgi:hypothetical protein
MDAFLSLFTVGRAVRFRKALGLGSAPGTSGENVTRAAGNVRSEPITSRFPALACFAHFSNLPWSN